jgi:hypothetical protein
MSLADWHIAGSTTQNPGLQEFRETSRKVGTRECTLLK